MPEDIRSFFTPKGRGLQDKSKATPTKGSAAKGETLRRSKRRVVVDSDDEEESRPKRTTPKKPARPPPKKEEEVIETSSYFASKNKIHRTAPTRPSKASEKKKVVQPSKPVVEDNDIASGDDGKPRRKVRQSSEPFVDIGDTQTTTLSPQVDNEDMMDLDDDDDFVPMQVEEDLKSKERAPPPRATAASKKRKTIPSDDEDSSGGKPAKAVKTASTKKNAAAKTASKTPKKKAQGSEVQKVLDSVPSDDEDSGEKPAKVVKTASTKKNAAAKKTASRTPKKKAQEEPASEVQKILDSVPTVRPPTPPPQEAGKKFNYRDFKTKQAQANVPPPGAGTKQVPVGADNCLAGLTFVFTGELETLSREDGQQLVKKYGGKVTTAPSKRTSFVVLGTGAGPKKLETIRANSIKTIDEDGLFQLIRILPANGGDSKVAMAAGAKRAAEEKKVMELAKEMAKAMTPLSKGKGKESDTKPEVAVDNQLWTVKYAPTTTMQICGNKTPVEKLQKWLKNWHNNAKLNFKKSGDNTGNYRAVMIHGPPGIGKTTAAHLVAKLEGFDIVESNASDTRSKKLMEASLKGVLDNKSLMGYFGQGNSKVDASKQKLVLIMDEVDGMSAGDRGGVGQLAAICRKTNIPIICICNERKLPKMKPFDSVALDLGFRRPDASAIRSRVMSIAFREGLKLPTNVIDALVEGTGSDIRQIINMISTFAVNNKEMDFDQGKAMSKQWEKHVILKPWDIASKLLGPSMFTPNANKSLNDKLELYFNDHEFSFLMIQENYLKTNPSRSSDVSGKAKNFKNLELIEAAASSISDGDLVDAMIHGPQQHWSLMPLHGVLSTVAPASYAYGGYGGQMFGFTSWLGMNSKQNKLSRYLKEIQSHMRLRASGDRNEIRQSYLPILWDLGPKKLELQGKEAISPVIELLDNYYLTRDDFDAIVELGIGPMSEANLNIPTLVKSSFTREYNAMGHPLPFIKATSMASTISRLVRKEVPDLEEAIEESDDEVALVDEEEEKRKLEEEEADLSKDKYVKTKKPGVKRKPAPSKPAATKGGGKGKGKRKARKEEYDDDDEIDDDNDDDAIEEDEEEQKPVPVKRGARGARGKGRGGRK